MYYGATREEVAVAAVISVNFHVDIARAVEVGGYNA
jgi:hypothetical protein